MDEDEVVEQLQKHPEILRSMVQTINTRFDIMAMIADPDIEPGFLIAWPADAPEELKLKARALVKLVAKAMLDIFSDELHKGCNHDHTMSHTGQVVMVSDDVFGNKN